MRVRNTIGVGLLLAFVPAVAPAELTSALLHFSVGDYRNCRSQLGRDVDTFEVLPIYGWDNLRNLDAGMVIAANYSKCRLTEDGKYLLPDDVYLIPHKRTRLHEFAELIAHWSNYTSATSKSINVDAGLSFHGFGISGKYSNSYSTFKTKQHYDKSVTTRVQVRYLGYTAKLQPSAPLDAKFKSALLDIAVSIQMNETAHARYQSELLVRDFGTHLVTSVDAGAALVKDDFILKDFVYKYESQKHDILAAASANFFGVVHFGTSFTSSTKNSLAESYNKSVTSSDIASYGGTTLMLSNYSFTKDLDNNLVAIDRSGDPIYYVITPENLPEVPPFIVKQVSESVQRAIQRYYEYNVRRGCLKPDAPNFSFQANVEDGSCEPASTNLTFGGVFQICEMAPGSSAGDLCGNLRQANPKTGKYSCPPNYKQVLLHTENHQKSSTSRPCHSCGWWSTCCHTEYRQSRATVTTYWCVADATVPPDSGYLFGGMYSSVTDNPLTFGKSCPDTYYARMAGSDLKVCISDDFEMAGKDSIPFGGFYSCEMGNPLAEKKSEVTASNGKMSPLNTLREYYRKQGKTGWPKKCPKGFSAHLGIISQECAIHYCIVAGALTPKGLPAVRRPPFTKRPEVISTVTMETIFNIQNKTWTPSRPQHTAPSTDNGSHSPSVTSNISPGVVAVVSVLVTLAAVGCLILMVKFVRRRRRNAPTAYGEIGADTPVGYGSTGQPPAEGQNC